MTVNPAKAAGHAEHEGRTYYFCGRSCLERFKADPTKYVGQPQASAPHVVADAVPARVELETHARGVEYTCPMHPEIIRDRPGACPICGMALEPRTVSAEEGPHPELGDMTRRFWAAPGLSLPVFLIAMSEMLPGRPLHFLDMRLLNAVQLVLAT